MITDAMTARLKPVQPGRATLVAVLDIGSTKMCCVIARLTPRAEGKALRGRSHAIEVIGFGYGPSAGIKSGVITDLDKAEQAIRSVVGMAERAAGLTVESVIVNVTAGRLGSETFSATVSLDGHEVETADLARVLRAVNERSVAAERSIIHALPIGYALDGQRGISTRAAWWARSSRSMWRWSPPRRWRCAISNWRSTAAICRSRRWSQRPMPRACVAGRRRSPARRGRHRFRRRDDHGFRVQRRRSWSMPTRLPSAAIT